MTKDERAIRAGILCSHFIRNLAFYDAGQNKTIIRQNQFWTTLNSNFLDIAVLEWCKLFADIRGNHYWSKVIDKPDFLDHMLIAIGTNIVGFDACIKEMRSYRDRFIAHLDDDQTMNIPHLEIAYKAATCLYDTLLDQQLQCPHFQAQRYIRGSDMYKYYFNKGEDEYKTK